MTEQTTAIDVYERLKTGYYTDVTYPGLKSTYVKAFIDQQIESFIGTKKEILDEEARLGALGLDQYEQLLAAYHEMKTARFNEFQTDLLDYHGVQGNAMAEKLFYKCYQQSHSFGLNDVAIMFGDFVEILQ